MLLEIVKNATANEFGEIRQSSVAGHRVDVKWPADEYRRRRSMN